MTLDLYQRSFFGHGNWQSSIVHFASSFQGHIFHVSSAVVTQPKMSSCLSKRSWQIVTLLCFCSSMSSFGTIFAHVYLISRSSVKIFLTFSVDVHLLCYAPDSQPMIFTHSLMNFAMFSSVLLVAGRPDLSSLVTLSLPSEKRFTRL